MDKGVQVRPLTPRGGVASARSTGFPELSQQGFNLICKQLCNFLRISMRACLCMCRVSRARKGGHARARVHMRASAHMRACMLVHMYTSTYIRRHMHTYVCICTQTHTGARAHIHRRIHLHTYTSKRVYMHTCKARKLETKPES